MNDTYTCPTPGCDHDVRLPSGGVIVLKTEENAWDALERGDKTAEFRLNDRDYHVGDRLILRRGTDDKPTLTLHRTVTHAIYGPAFGIPEGYVMLSLGPCDCYTHELTKPNATVATLQDIDLLRDAAFALDEQHPTLARFVRSAMVEIKRNREPSDERVRYVIKELGLEEDIGDAIAVEDIRRILTEAAKR